MSAGTQPDWYIGFADGYGDGWLGEMRRSAQTAGIKIVGEEKYNRTDASVTGQVLKLVAEGSSNKEVAETLDISVKTAMAHREHLMEKLDVHSRTELIRFALRRGVIRI